MRADSDSDERRWLVAAIEEEMSKILSTDYGMVGVQVHIDPQTGDIVSSQAIPDDLKPRIFSAAVKQAVTRRAREIEGDLE